MTIRQINRTNIVWLSLSGWRTPQKKKPPPTTTKKKTDLQGFVRLHMLKHIPGMRRMASEWQERPCICRSISWPSCRLASYLLNETVPTDLDNRTLASAPRSLALRALLYHRDSLCQREAAQTALDPAVGGYAEPHNRQLQMLPLLLLQCSWRFFFLSLSLYRSPLITDMTVTRDCEWYTRESGFNSHSPTYHLDGCVAVIPTAVDSFRLGRTMWLAGQWGGLKCILPHWLMIVTGSYSRSPWAKIDR